ncbi:hypothetical protein SAMN06265222_107241 [Neorhodopirellula lusitana]|uniref:Uncharacterized protein n=1 Tax=Neorhodopirellula lusitana TaxID=445327 RepID=A0ABY1Q7Q8_9BACT|nr:hypothetical protein [Neorhodopirellula lusitana]SMP62130.1 hypothetical protein SAMN06265222_107241 [Neorhodopirellula lusitana]
MNLRPDIALSLLDECTGDDLWSVEHCRARGVPEAWIDDLADAYESGFRARSQTIYVSDEKSGNRVINQYFGVRDIDLAKRIGTQLGLDVEQIQAVSFSRQSTVDRIKEAVMDG